MMKLNILSATAIATLITVGVAQAEADFSECEAPDAPDVPEAFNDADQKDAVKQDVMAFVGASQDYLACLDRIEATFNDDTEKKTRKKWMEAYNDNVDEQHAVAAAYNEVAQSFNDANN